MGPGAEVQFGYRLPQRRFPLVIQLAVGTWLHAGHAPIDHLRIVAETLSLALPGAHHLFTHGGRGRAVTLTRKLADRNSGHLNMYVDPVDERFADT